MKPIRSVLYVPGNKEGAINKIKTLDADGYILDLEDAVLPQNKEDARQIVDKYLKLGHHANQQVIVRVNQLGSHDLDLDLQTLNGHKIDALLFPKIESESDLVEICQLLDHYQFNRDIEIWAMIETPLGILNCQAICSVTSRLKTLVMGGQ